jgi:SagB-type dehydrogenase family enzyme
VPTEIALELVTLFAGPITRADARARTKLTPAVFDDAVDAFLGVAALEAAATKPDPADAARWEPHDLLFHQVAAQAGNGGWHEVAEGEPPPAVKPTMSNATTIALRDVELSNDCSLQSSFARRRSIREYAVTKEISLDTFSTFLSTVRNMRGTDATRWNHEWMPGKYVARAYPSGGARYSLEIYLAIAKSAFEGVPSGLYRYCPANHHLEQLSVDPAIVNPILASVSSESMQRPPEGVDAPSVIPPAVAVITSRIHRVTYKYGGVAYDLILKEVGALLQTLALSAAALGLAGCPLGAVPAARGIYRTASPGLTPEEEPIVGYYMFGLPHPCSRA